MSSVVQQMNALLNPFLFQVIGSTPASIRDAIKDSGLKGKPQEALGLATVCIFAAAVNKATLENFIVKPELDFARKVVMANFTVSGKVNMTGVTLLGHCLLTSNVLEDVVFVKEFRHKMGQPSIWEGEMKAGSLSDKQKEILAEKKRVTEHSQARLLGSGFFKFCGIDPSAWTNEERDFWGENQPATQPSHAPPFAPQPSQPSSSGAKQFYTGAQTSAQTSQAPYTSPTRQTTASTPPQQPQRTYAQASSSSQRPPTAAPSINDVEDYTFASGETFPLSRAATDFYMSNHNNDEGAMYASVKSRGATAFNAIYSTAANRGLNAAATVAGSTRG